MECEDGCLHNVLLDLLERKYSCVKMPRPIKLSTYQPTETYHHLPNQGKFYLICRWMRQSAVVPGVPWSFDSQLIRSGPQKRTAALPWSACRQQIGTMLGPLGLDEWVMDPQVAIWSQILVKPCGQGFLLKLLGSKTGRHWCHLPLGFIIPKLAWTLAQQST